MKKRILYIVNPISGTQRKQGFEQLAASLTDCSLYEAEFVRTEYAGHATELTKQAVADGVDVVVAVGGDGTVNEVASALVHSRTALGIVPCGSGNGLARHLHLPMSPAEAIGILNLCVIREFDYGTINGRPFFCTCGIGFDAFISQKFAESGRRGVLTYVENTLREGLLYRPQTYSIENPQGTETCKAFLIACANASQYGNEAKIAPQASMSDGLLDVVVMEPFNALDAPQVALQLFTGRLPENSHVHTFQTNRLRISREAAGVAHCDGDPFLTGKVIDVRLQHKAFRAVVNPNSSEEGPREGKPLFQLVPDFFHEWRQVPETFLAKTSQDLRRINKTLLRRLSGKKGE